jgi:hypothetical protein
MPFFKAGLNDRHRRTGIRACTRHVKGKRYEPAELIVFTNGYDFAWHGRHRHGGEWVAWGEQAVIGTWDEFDLSAYSQPGGLPMCELGANGGAPGKVVLTIIGEPASKANSRKLVMLGRGPKARPAFIKSDKGRAYEHDALFQIPPSARKRLDGPVRVTMRIFYATERPDLDESLILDVLQDRYEGAGDERVLVQKGVYRNDRQVREKHVFHAIDKANPRAEIEVEPIVAQADMLSRAA